MPGLDPVPGPCKLGCRTRTGPPPWALTRLQMAVIVATVCVAQSDEAAAQTSRVVPSLSASTSYSDTSRSNTNTPDRQFITQVSPGLSWSSRSGRVQGSASYRLNARHYSKQSGDVTDNLQQALSAQLSAEAIDDWMFVDAAASISQQATSPFGQQTADDSLINNPNRTEVTTVSVSPHVGGNLMGWAIYQARLTAAHTNSGGVSGANSDTRTGSVSLASPSSGAIFGWNLGASWQESEFSSGAESQSDQVNAGVTARLPDLLLGLTVGRESGNVRGGRRSTSDTWGWNLRWTPTPRTNVALSSQRRYFGNSHSATFTHRMRRSSWVYSDTRSDNTGASGLAGGQPVTLFALYFELFAAQEPDPALREILVLDFLRSTGQDPGALVSLGFVTQSVTLQRRQDLALAMQWQRSSVSLRAFRTKTSQLQTGSGALPSEVSQKGYTASLSYRLTPASSMSLSGSRQITDPAGVNPGSTLDSVSLSLTDRLGPRTSLSYSLRHTEFDNALAPYREFAATASLSLQF